MTYLFDKKIKLQDCKECFVTGRTDGLQRHHIFGAANRKLSEKYGLCVWLRPEWHNASNYAVHFNRAFDLRLKRYAQREFEAIYDRETFIKLFGKNYL